MKKPYTETTLQQLREINSIVEFLAQYLELDELVVADIIVNHILKTYTKPACSACSEHQNSHTAKACPKHEIQ